MYATPRPWGEAERARTKALWSEGYSASQIARKLASEGFPKRSRNAVIGKLHRLGFTRGSDAQRAHTERKVRIKRQASIVFVPNKVLRVTRHELLKGELAEIKALEPVSFEGGPRTILTIQAGECRFMAGEGPDAPLCGRACAGTWCDQHARLVYQPAPNRRKEHDSLVRVAKWLDRKIQAQAQAA